MFLVKIVFVAFTCTQVIKNVYVASQEAAATEDNGEGQPQEEEKTTPKDHHTFVALIDIIFLDGRKRTCTGTIIHDYVVVTAAHCFSDGNKIAEVELTASFVIIGTKKMFETGYENYLPIERVLTHPKYEGWTADIALVYTFAGMTTDKPGNVIALVGEKVSTPVDSNVTILSWGHCKDDEGKKQATKRPKEEDVCEEGEELIDDSCEPKGTYGRMAQPVASSAESSEQENEKVHGIGRTRESTHHTKDKKHGKGKKSHNTSSIYEPKDKKHGDKNRHELKEASVHEWLSPLPELRIPVDVVSVTKISPVTDKNDDLSSPEEKESDSEIEKENAKIEGLGQPNKKQRHRYHKAHRNSSDIDLDTKFSYKIMDDSADLTKRTHVRAALMENEDIGDFGMVTTMDQDFRKFLTNLTKPKKEQTYQKDNYLKKYYKNWRRLASPQMMAGAKIIPNRLSVETFGFVNVQTCKKIVDRSMPSKYQINPSYVVCYASEDHYMNDEDSGAPAVNQGQLVAVTVGGVECDGDHIAIGMKMSCYCSWIAENLPGTGNSMECCKNCCEGNEKEDQKPNKKHTTKRRFRYL